MGYLNPQAGRLREGRPAEPVDDIADTSTATAEDVGNKLNELLASLRAAGLLAE